ncbi:transporter substrate-binding domain-containing protein [Pleurocapsales cyanobacterium LEGE 06147]|nr:transporter substrate-binding domain-containing protein [Pleurocapsales cyanobacterium LEGE 06147]
MINWRILRLSLVVGTLLLALGIPRSLLAAELADIKRRGHIIVAVKDNFRPLGFIDNEGNLVGLEIDLARRLAEELFGDREAVVFQPVGNQDRLKVVLDDRVDLAIARVTATPSRRRIVDFSPYYYLDGTSLVTKNPLIQSTTELTRATIAVLEGSATIAVIRHNLPNARLIGVKSYEEALNVLEIEKADAFAGDRSLLAGWVQEYPDYKLLPQRLSGDPLSIVMPKGLQYESLRQEVDRAIARWRESGWLQERIEFWGLP